VATIAWDRDDVLNDLMLWWLEKWWKRAHPDCRINYEDLTENPPHEILGISMEQYLSSLDAFRLSGEASRMEPVAEVLEWLKQYGHLHRHMVLTATSLNTGAPAAEWTFRHFGAWIQSFHLVPSVRKTQHGFQHDVDKGEYLHWLGKVDVLVDDSPTHLESASSYGITGVLIPRPWNTERGTITEALNRLLAAVAGG